MESDFFSEVKNYFSNEFEQQLSISLNEQKDGIHKALSVIIPVATAATIQRVERDKGNLSSVFTMAKAATGYVPEGPDLESLHNEWAENRVISVLLGKHETPVNHAIAKYSGIKNESASPLMLLGTSVMLKTLGSHANKNNLSADQLDDYIAKLKDKTKELIPEGVKDLGVVFGLQEGTVDEKHLKDTVQTDSVQPKNKGWIAPIILAVLAALLLVYLSKGCN